MIGDVKEIFDLERFREYNEVVPTTIAQYGGRFLVRGGERQSVEGDWEPGRIVVLEFDDMNSLQTWYNSDEYSAVRGKRQSSAVSNILFVEGAADVLGTGGAA